MQFQLQSHIYVALQSVSLSVYVIGIKGCCTLLGLYDSHFSFGHLWLNQGSQRHCCFYLSYLHILVTHV